MARALAMLGADTHPTLTFAPFLLVCTIWINSIPTFARGAKSPVGFLFLATAPSTMSVRFFYEKYYDYK